MSNLMSFFKQNIWSFFVALLEKFNMTLRHFNVCAIKVFFIQIIKYEKD